MCAARLAITPRSMKLMTRPTPPLNPLKVFEAAARLGNFTRASEELLVSQSAVSRQISLLEEYLGVRLFDRQKVGVTLTPAGVSYFAEIGPAFQRIVGATERLLRVQPDEPLVIRAYSTFAANWLMRRMPRWEADYPAIRLRISTALTPVDFSKEPVDASIEIRPEVLHESVDVEFLFENQVVPVCSPGLIAGSPGLQPRDLLGYRLIHSRFRPRDWGYWLTAQGLDSQTIPDSLEFADSLLAYQAAMDGLGIAMGQPRFLQAEFQAGKLICPVRGMAPLTLPRPYSFVTQRFDARAKTKRFFEWIRYQVEADELDILYP